MITCDWIWLTIVHFFNSVNSFKSKLNPKIINNQPNGMENKSNTFFMKATIKNSNSECKKKNQQEKETANRLYIKFA